MGQHAKSLLSWSSSKSEQSKYSMHKGSMSVPRKRKLNKSSSGDQVKKRKVVRSNGAEAQSRPAAVDSDRKRLSERQQIALALEESKRTAAAERVHKHQASKKAAQESDSDDVTDSEQDSVCEDESASKGRSRPVKSEQPADSLVSQQSDVASQLGKHKHQLYARNGRLESLSGGSKQSHSSSKAPQTLTSVPESSTPELHRVESDAESHPGHLSRHIDAADSSKHQQSPERQRTSDVSSRDVLEAIEELSRVKDESQSEELTAVRLPMKEDGLDLVNIRTQRLALRHASSQMLQASATGSLPRSDSKRSKPDQTKLDGMSASPHHPFAKLKVRTKREDSLKHDRHNTNADSPAALDGHQSSRLKGSVQTPRQLEHRNSDATPRSWQLQQRQSAPMAQLVESDLFGDLTPCRAALEPRPSVPVISLHPNPTSDTQAAPSHRSQPHLEQPVPKSQSLPKSGVKVVVKQHRLATTDGYRPAVEEQPPAAVQLPTPAVQLPAAEHIKDSNDEEPREQQSDQQQQQQQHTTQPEAQPEPASQPTKVRKPVKQGRGRPSASFLRAVSQEAALQSPAAQSAGKMQPSDATMQAAQPLAVPETDARACEASAPAAKGRGRVHKPPKRSSTLTGLGRKASRTGVADDAYAKGSQSFGEPRGRQKPFSLLAACNALDAQEAAWTSATQHWQPAVANIRPDSDAQLATVADHNSNSTEEQTAAASTLLNIKKRHLFEGSLLTSSMVAASEASEKANHRSLSSRPSSSKGHSELQSRMVEPDAQPMSCKSACDFLWEPLRVHREADHLFESRKWSREELTSQDPRSPRRTASHRTYDSSWDDLLARQACELQTLDSFRQWYHK